MKNVNLANLARHRFFLRAARLTIQVLLKLPFATPDERAGRQAALAEIDRMLSAS